METTGRLPAGRPAHIVIIGPGALGTFFAARLAQAGHSVSVIARGSRLAAIRRDGLQLESNGLITAVPVRAVDDPALISTPDLAIIATKTTGLAGAIAALVPHATPALGVLTVQNGVEAPAMVAAALPRVQVLAGRVHGFFEMADDLVRHVGVPPSLAFGQINPAPAPAPAADLLATCLTGAGIAFTRPADIAAALWEKLMLVSSIGGVGAALGLPIGAIRDDPAHAAMLRAAIAEVAAVAAAHGAALPPDCVATTLAFVGTFPAEATSSLHRDLVARRPSEFDHLTGAIPRLAARHGVPVPVHTAIIARLAGQGLV